MDCPKKKGLSEQILSDKNQEFLVFFPAAALFSVGKMIEKIPS